MPTDAAFEAAGLSLAAIKRLTPEQQRRQLRGLLAYHGVSLRVGSTWAPPPCLRVHGARSFRLGVWHA